eukprot:595770-Prorocentrum_minimum.AAC.1
MPINGLINLLYSCLRASKALSNRHLTKEDIPTGASWEPPKANSLPNPNTKVHAIRLRNGVLMAAYNHHKYRLRQRSNLFVATSTDECVVVDAAAGPSSARAECASGECVWL